MTDEIRRRSACDRCHGQKLRCPRRPGLEVCDRCMKAKTSCIYSPFRQKKTVDKNQTEQQGLRNQVPSDIEVSTSSSSDESNEQEHQVLKRRRGIEEYDNEYTSNSSFRLDIDYQPTPETTNNSYSFVATQDFETNIFNDIDLGMQSPFPSFDINPLSPSICAFTSKPDSLPFLSRPSVPFTYHLPQPQVQVQTSLMDFRTLEPNSTQFGTIPIAIGWKFQRETLSLDTVGRCVGRLSTLSNELYEHSLTLPPLEIYKPTTPEEDIDRVINPPVEYHLDETFRLTQEMIDIYPTVNNLCSVGDSIPNTISNVQSDSPSKPGSKSVDHSTLLLALSCHLRLIDIYDALFAHMDLCVMHQGKIPNMNVVFVAPVIKIGNFVPPQSSSVPMQMLLFVQLASQLSSYSTDLVTTIKDLHDADDMVRNGAKSADSISAFTLATADSVREKADKMTKTLADLRRQILDSGLLA